MQITDNARPVLQKLLADEGKKGLTCLVQGQGCHSQLVIDFIEEEKGELINGVYVDMDEVTARALADFYIDADGDRLVLRSNSQGCGGGCGGCGGGCGDSGCGDGCCCD